MEIPNRILNTDWQPMYCGEHVRGAYSARPSERHAQRKRRRIDSADTCVLDEVHYDATILEATDWRR
jgi:hypothetical protein